MLLLLLLPKWSPGEHWRPLLHSTRRARNTKTFALLNWIRARKRTKRASTGQTLWIWVLKDKLGQVKMWMFYLSEPCVHVHFVHRILNVAGIFGKRGHKVDLTTWHPSPCYEWTTSYCHFIGVKYEVAVMHSQSASLSFFLNMVHIHCSFFLWKVISRVISSRNKTKSRFHEDNCSLRRHRLLLKNLSNLIWMKLKLTAEIVNIFKMLFICNFIDISVHWLIYYHMI